MLPATQTDMENSVRRKRQHSSSHTRLYVVDKSGVLDRQAFTCNAADTVTSGTSGAVVMGRHWLNKAACLYNLVIQDIAVHIAYMP